jgi:hypothetical protein
MANRIACVLALIAFVMTLLIGCFEAGNGFGMVVLRALAAMLGTLVVGFIVGVMAEKMMAEHLSGQEKKLLKSAQESEGNGR